jgi:hypothetical protein
MKLIHTSTNVEVKVGDVVTDFRGDKGTVTHFAKPTSAASEGKITVVDEDGHSCYCYVSVFKLEWVDREDCPKTYKIMRNFESGKVRVLKTGRTLAEAQAHCANPETSSATCSPETLYPLRTKGAWFDSYTEE